MIESAPFRLPLLASFMSSRILDGRACSRGVRESLLPRVEALAARGARPGLAVLQVGNDPASRIYVRNKVRACTEARIESVHIELPGNTDERDILERIRTFNSDPRVHGILVQLPLPPELAADRIQNALDPNKDVDGFHPINVGLLAIGTPRFVPCTPLGVTKLLAHEGIPVEGRHAVVVGRRNIVGKPMALLLLQKGATVTICHSKTPDLGDITGQADILVVAAGKPKLVTAEMVKPGAVVIDVGINRLADGTLAGDVDFEGVSQLASHITPVPGGVGPMTIAMLVENTVLACERLLDAAPGG